jgi:uncharacterized protein (TIGR02646 family)
MKISYKFRDKIPIKRNLPAKSHYRDYRNDLRLDFFKRCGYCNDPDDFRDDYHIDHFAPQADFKHLAHEYRNLVYSCPTCNTAKGRDWVTDSCDISYTSTKGYLNPCESVYDDGFTRDEFGEIVALSPVARYMYLKLKFYLPRHAIYWNLYRIQQLINKLNRIAEKYPNNKEIQDCRSKLNEHFFKFFNRMTNL